MSRKNWLFLIAISMLFSCNRNVNNVNEQNAGRPYSNQTEIHINSGNSALQVCNITHYVTNNLNLYESADLSSIKITILPIFSALTILETGNFVTIDDISAPWIKIESKSGFIGWCFSGFVKQIENNITEELTHHFRNRRGRGTGMSFPLWEYSEKAEREFNPARNNVSSPESINSAQGYYVQQAARLANHGHSPEILALIFEEGNVLIREIDIIDRKIIIRNEIVLLFDGTTYSHNSTKLVTQNGEIQIIYHKHRPERYWSEIWDFDIPYTFAGDFSSAMPLNAQRLTTDYLSMYTGEYYFDKYELFDQANGFFSENSLKDASLQVLYNEEKKCLSLRASFNNFGNQQINFVETTAIEPFYWYFGEGAGYTEIMLFFYKGGIVFYNDKAEGFYNPEKDYFESNILHYIAFFKKKQ